MSSIIFCFFSKGREFYAFDVPLENALLHDISLEMNRILGDVAIRLNVVIVSDFQS